MEGVKVPLKIPKASILSVLANCKNALIALVGMILYRCPKALISLAQ